MSNQVSNFAAIPVNVLLIAGSPRRKGNSHKLLELADKTLKEFETITTDYYYLGDNNFDTLWEKWKKADAAIWIFPVYTMAGPAALSNLLVQLKRNIKEENGSYPAKVSAAIVQGSSRWGGQDIVLARMLSQFISDNCIPTKADMPGCHIGVAGHIVDMTEPNDNEGLLTDTKAAARRTVQLTRILKAGQEKKKEENVRLLVINADDSKGDAGSILTEEVADSLANNEKVVLERFSFRGSNMQFCRHCPNYCKVKYKCVHDDDFKEFYEKWMRANAVLWISSVENQGPPVSVSAALDRLSEIGFHSSWQDFFEGKGPVLYPKNQKAIGCAVFSDKTYGGQEQTAQFFAEHAVLQDNIPLSVPMEQSYLGAMSCVKNAEGAKPEKKFVDDTVKLASGLVNLAQIVNAGKRVGFDYLPKEYYPSYVQMGKTDKEGFFDE